jgi:hypothetical protein
MVRNAVWCLSNLCRGKNPAVDFNKVTKIRNRFDELMKHFYYSGCPSITCT